MNAASERPSLRMRSKAVLVVEDDEDIRDALYDLLRGEGYDTSVCANGAEALEHLRVGHPTDVILLDLMMPVMDGWQFRIEQKRDPRFSSIPVLAMSADTTAKAAAIDADVYLRKPLDEGTILGSIERALLATERRTLQTTLAETERLASLGTLAAGVAHEINNPLAYVMANLEYFASVIRGDAAERDDVELAETLAEAREGCERIRSIVQDLQIFSRPSEETQHDVDLRRLLDSASNMVVSEIRPRARLTKDYGEVPPIEASATRLVQVFVNLILNAAQAIVPGDPATNEIRLVTREENGTVVVQVRDTGEGIRPEIRGKIFDPFFTTKPVGVGTGLGLSISHRLVTAMRGELTVASELGVGTTFSVRLPITGRKARAAAPAPPAMKARRRARVLVVDDEPAIVRMLARALGTTHDVEAVTSPDVAIERVLAGEHFDLILCDLMMPERSGIEVHAAIERFSPERAARMIFLTGGALTPKAEAFLSRRMVVRKPFSIDELLRRIDGALATLEK